MTKTVFGERGAEKQPEYEQSTCKTCGRVSEYPIVSINSTTNRLATQCSMH